MAYFPTDPISVESVSSLEFMAGSWIEEAEHHRCEEVWSTPDGDALMGMFRWISSEEISFYEFMVVRPTNEHVELHVKHFHPSLVAWEEKERFQAFVLSHLEERMAIFAAVPEEDGVEETTGWVIYELGSDDRLYVRLVQPNGEPKLVFQYEREAV